MGWVNLDEWTEQGHHPDDHRSAKEFVERDSFFKKIAAQKRQLALQDAKITELSKFQQVLFDHAKEEALRELKAQHRIAVENGDLQAADVLVDRIQQTSKAQPPRSQVPPSQPAVQEAVESWKAENKWYDTNRAMRAFADVEGAKYINAYRQNNKGAIPAPEEVLEHVTKEVKNEFKDQFAPRPPKAPPSPEGSGNAPSRAPKSKFSEADLNPDERRVMESLVRRGQMTKEQYIKSLAELNSRS
jgi:hypothetical protein